MTDFTAGAGRRAIHGARAARRDAATDLVTRTLARHGLASGLGSGASPQTLSSPLADMVARFQQTGRPASPAAALPDGASFAEGSFTCAAGTRRYRSYVPASARDGVTGLVVMLHGCTQTPEDFAAGTGMNALAETHGFVVIYPQQSRGDNAQSCWNWFSRGDQRRDRGEPAILAGLTREAIARHGVPQSRVFVAGLSAGAAMAMILGAGYPDLFHGVGAHSGLPVGAAKDVPQAFAAMAGQGGTADPVRTLPRTIVFHGSADSTVHPSNGDRIEQQALDGGAGQSLQSEDRGTANGRAFLRRVTSDSSGADAVEYWRIEGLGHAWSGGDAAGSYADPQGPDASAEMVRFFFAGPAA
ncbi:alpha/beta hydrolase family esterase [Salipiger marinus]|uniref:extracellular catalytic domain type 1 short-chain-length polyhydroxyalkanoate depolymerase n=1 Tax=Salipiger marinus TaxID=555512 RepID=UPI001E56CDEA|nr:PHB depolymerase family esterase [Salipiger manganoxidans]MCD1617857.1 PHB depolymerase family esterase [Salipiger manganoxidans]MEB3418533.1 PHB depolymerase family esterase [Salipiger manganoxidans]